MNIARAKTEAEVAYEERRQGLDHQIRIAYVAHSLLGRLIEGDAGERILGALYGNLTKKTRRVVRVPKAEIAVKQAAQKGIALSIAAIHSDFEWACRDLLADALEFWEPRFTLALGRIEAPPPRSSPITKRGWAGTISEMLRSQSADEGFFQGCYALVGFKATNIDFDCLPLYDYFRRCRNRIIHQDGTAGRDLVEFARSQAVQKNLASLAPNVRRMSPSLPQLNANELILLTPQHAILFLVITFNLFRALAARVKALLTEDGFLRMTAHYAYGASQHSLRQQEYRNVVYPAVVFLRYRYGVNGIRKEEVIQRFKSLELWDSMAMRFKELFSIRKI
jgi:hypothetical protein